MLLPDRGPPGPLMIMVRASRPAVRKTRRGMFLAVPSPTMAAPNTLTATELAHKIDAGTVTAEAIVRAHLDFPDVEQWTHETPSLYRAVVTLFDPSGAVCEVAACRVGFRRVEVAGTSFLLNGAPITFFGVNRHDFDPDTGRAIY